MNEQVTLTRSERDYVALVAIQARSLDEVVAMVEHIVAVRLESLQGEK